MTKCFVVVVALLVLLLTSCAITIEFYGLKLHNNIFARDVSSEELMAFLEQDPTNEREVVEYRHKDCFVGELPTDARLVGVYDKSKSVRLGTETLHEYITSGYMCVNFGVDLHNNAEKAGIRCAIVESPEKAHVFNVFNTTDKGLVFVDASTGIDSFAYDQGDGTFIAKSLVREGVAVCAYRLLGDPKQFRIVR